MRLQIQLQAIADLSDVQIDSYRNLTSNNNAKIKTLTVKVNLKMSLTIKLLFNRKFREMELTMNQTVQTDQQYRKMNLDLFYMLKIDLAQV